MLESAGVALLRMGILGLAGGALLCAMTGSGQAGAASKGTQVADILLVPIGVVDAKVLESVAAELGGIFGARVRVGRTALEVPAKAYDSSRRQYRSDILLAALRGNRPAPRAALLGVTEVDLYAEGLNFVFGQADLKQGVAVISLARLRPAFWGRPHDPSLLLERAVKEAVHELGHTFGLRHCPDFSCVMHFSNSLADTDRKRKHFCAACGRRLRQAQDAARQGE